MVMFKSTVKKQRSEKYSHEYRVAKLRTKLMEQLPDGFPEGVFESKRRNKIKIRYRLDDYARVKTLRNGVVRYYLKFVKEDEPKIVSFDGGHPDIDGWRVGDLVEMDVKIEEWEWLGKKYYGYHQASDIVNISLMTGYGRADGDEKPELKFYD